jgi:hypothetical protein
VLFQGKSGRFAVRPGVVIDASGDGDVFAAAGCTHELEEVLPWLWFTVAGVEDATAAVDGGAGCFCTVAEGKVLFPWGATEKLRRIDPTSPEDLSFALLECRRRVMEVMDRLRREVPGFAKASLCQVADQLGITESRRLQGRYVLAREDMDAPFDDAIAITGHWTKAGVTYSIPFRCLLPRELESRWTTGCTTPPRRSLPAWRRARPPGRRPRWLSSRASRWGSSTSRRFEVGSAPAERSWPWESPPSTEPAARYSSVNTGGNGGTPSIRVVAGDRASGLSR